MRLVGAAEMRAIDRAAIDGLGIPSLQLMTRAGATGWICTRCVQP